MSHSIKYNGAITAEKFLFYEMRIAARFYTQNVPIEKAIEESDHRAVSHRKQGIKRCIPAFMTSCHDDSSCAKFFVVF